MAEEKSRTITLAEFARRAVEGEEIEQELVDGSVLKCRVHAPTQEFLLAIQGMMSRIFRVAESMRGGGDVSDDDASLIYRIGLECLRACVKDESGAEIPDPAFVDLFGNLPVQSGLMLKCQDLCGASMIQIPPLSNAEVADRVKDGVRRAQEERDSLEAAVDGEGSAPESAE